MSRFKFTFRIRDEAKIDRVEIDAETLTEAVALFLEGNSQTVKPNDAATTLNRFRWRELSRKNQRTPDLQNRLRSSFLNL